VIGIAAGEFGEEVVHSFIDGVRRDVEKALRDEAMKLEMKLEAASAVWRHRPRFQPIEGGYAPSLCLGTRPHELHAKKLVRQAGDVSWPCDWICEYCGSRNRAEAAYCGQVVREGDVAHCGAPNPQRIER
jgi:hypothetical protein